MKIKHEDTFFQKAFSDLCLEGAPCLWLSHDQPCIVVSHHPQWSFLIPLAPTPGQLGAFTKAHRQRMLDEKISSQHPPEGFIQSPGLGLPARLGVHSQCTPSPGVRGYWEDTGQAGKQMRAFQGFKRDPAGRG